MSHRGSRTVSRLSQRPGPELHAMAVELCAGPGRGAFQDQNGTTFQVILPAANNDAVTSGDGLRHR